MVISACVGAESLIRSGGKLGGSNNSYKTIYYTSIASMLSVCIGIINKRGPWRQRCSAGNCSETGSVTWLIDIFSLLRQSYMLNPIIIASIACSLINATVSFAGKVRELWILFRHFESTRLERTLDDILNTIYNVHDGDCGVQCLVARMTIDRMSTESCGNVLIDRIDWENISCWEKGFQWCL